MSDEFRVIVRRCTIEPYHNPYHSQRGVAAMLGRISRKDREKLTKQGGPLLGIQTSEGWEGVRVILLLPSYSDKLTPLVRNQLKRAAIGLQQLLKDCFGIHANIRMSPKNASLRPHREAGLAIAVKVVEKESGKELDPGLVLRLVKEVRREWQHGARTRLPRAVSTVLARWEQSLPEELRHLYAEVLKTYFLFPAVRAVEMRA